jgi:chemotaxis protein MotB
MPTRKKKQVEEEHANHERWLISYADMVTLLMVLFIVLFAISQVDQKRFDMLKDGMAAGFGSTPSPFQGTDAVLNEQSVTPLGPIQPVRMSLDGSDSKEQDEAVDREVRRRDKERAERTYADAVAEVKRLEDVRRRLLVALRRHGLANDVRMRIDERGLSISLVSRHIVFAPNIADLSPRGVRIVRTLTPVLRALPDQLEIDGHTNQVKVQPKYYPTDWDLASARAITVLRHLDEKGGVPARRLSSASFGHTKPLIDPSLPRSQKLNKRVDIVVLSGATEQTRVLFTQIVADRNRG